MQTQTAGWASIIPCLPAGHPPPSLVCVYPHQSVQGLISCRTPHLRVTSTAPFLSKAITYDSLLFQPCSYMRGLPSLFSQGSACTHLLLAGIHTCTRRTDGTARHTDQSERLAAFSGDEERNNTFFFGGGEARFPRDMKCRLTLSRLCYCSLRLAFGKQWTRHSAAAYHSSIACAQYNLENKRVKNERSCTRCEGGRARSIALTSIIDRIGSGFSRVVSYGTVLDWGKQTVRLRATDLRPDVVRPVQRNPRLQANRPAQQREAVGKLAASPLRAVVRRGRKELEQGTTRITVDVVRGLLTKRTQTKLQLHAA